MKEKHLPTLTYTIEEDQTGCFVRFSGVLNENSQLPTLSGRYSCLIFNTAEIKYINSQGVRDWVNWINQFQQDIYLVECSTSFMGQANLISNFVGNASLLSFFLPLHCPDCAVEAPPLLISTPQAKENSYHISTCKTCGKKLEVNEFLDSYFMFLRKAKVSPLDEKVFNALMHFAPSTADLFKQKMTRGSKEER